MKIEQAKELAEKALAQLAETLEQGHSDQLKKYLAAMASLEAKTAVALLLTTSRRRVFFILILRRKGLWRTNRVISFKALWTCSF